MGGIGGLILPDGGEGHLGPGVVPVAEEGDEGGVDVPGQHVGRVVVQLPDGQLVLDPQHHPGLGHGVVLGNAQLSPHGADELGGGDAGVHQQSLRQIVGDQAVQQGLGPLLGGELLHRRGPLLRLGLRGGDRLRVAEEVFPQSLGAGLEGLEVGEKQLLLLFVHLVHGVGVGGQPGDGEVVAPGHALRLAELDQAENGLVAVFPRAEEVRVEGQIIGGAVGDQGLSVAVGEDAPGGFHLLRPHDGADGLGGVFIVVDDLHVVEHEKIGDQYQHQEGGEQIEAGILHFLAVHRAPFYLEISRRNGFFGRRSGKAASGE